MQCNKKNYLVNQRCLVVHLSHANDLTVNHDCFLLKFLSRYPHMVFGKLNFNLCFYLFFVVDDFSPSIKNLFSESAVAALNLLLVPIMTMADTANIDLRRV